MIKLSIPVQWICLGMLTAGVTYFFNYLHIPAALLLGPMLSAVTVSIVGFTLRIPKKFFFFAQGIVGCMIAQQLSPSALNQLLANWVIVVFVIICTLSVAFFSGWLLARYTSLPGSTAIWGSSPGAASTMVIMSMDSPNADARLVAFMQYYRVLIVSGLAIFISHYLVLNFMGTGVVQHHKSLQWITPLTWRFGQTILLIVIAAFIAKKLCIPSANMLGPLIVCAVLQSTSTVTLELPHWLLAGAYIIIGFGIGVRFTRETVKLATRALPQISIAVLALVLFCIGLAWCLTVTLDIDFFTAYLATSPGGMDAIAIIAANSPVDLSFVMGIQTARLLITLVLSPVLAKHLSKNKKINSGNEI